MRLTWEQILQRMLIFMHPGSKAYDPEFASALTTLRPDWKPRRIPRKAKNKTLLLKLAASGEPKPSYNTRLGRALCNYTQRWSASFDAELHDILAATRPDWLVRRGPAGRVVVGE